MRTSGRLLLTVLGICLAVGAAQATPIAITNPGFEAQTAPPGAIVGTITGWSIGFGADRTGVIVGGAADACPLGGTGGTNVAYSVPDSGFYQSIGTIEGNMRYTLTVGVGDVRHAGDPSPWDPGFPSEPLATLDRYGGGELLSLVSTVAPTPANGQMVVWTMTYEVPSDYEFIGEELWVVLGARGTPVGGESGTAQIVFDDVAVDAEVIPEPATMTLLAVGIGGILLKRRR